jgi:hypothetical protein
MRSVNSCIVLNLIYLCVCFVQSLVVEFEVGIDFVVELLQLSIQLQDVVFYDIQDLHAVSIFEDYFVEALQLIIDPPAVIS